MWSRPGKTKSAFFVFGRADRRGSGRGCNPRVLLHRLSSILSAPTKGKLMTMKLKRMASSPITGSWQKGYAPDF